MCELWSRHRPHADGQSGQVLCYTSSKYHLRHKGPQANTFTLVTFHHLQEIAVFQPMLVEPTVRASTVTFRRSPRVS